MKYQHNYNKAVAEKVREIKDNSIKSCLLSNTKIPVSWSKKEDMRKEILPKICENELYKRKLIEFSYENPYRNKVLEIEKYEKAKRNFKNRLPTSSLMIENLGKLNLSPIREEDLVVNEYKPELPDYYEILRKNIQKEKKLVVEKYSKLKEEGEIDEKLIKNKVIPKENYSRKLILPNNRFRINIDIDYLEEKIKKGKYFTEENNVINILNRQNLLNQEMLRLENHDYLLDFEGEQKTDWFNIVDTNHQRKNYLNSLINKNSKETKENKGSRRNSKQYEAYEENLITDISSTKHKKKRQDDEGEDSSKKELEKRILSSFTMKEQKEVMNNVQSRLEEEYNRVLEEGENNLIANKYKKQIKKLKLKNARNVKNKMQFTVN